MKYNSKRFEIRSKDICFINFGNKGFDEIHMTGKFCYKYVVSQLPEQL